ncbi:MAG TPA: CHAD domain-containing protein [Ktedonobacterales bacterium]|jgi:exopolyphosphatase/guanosine-5'-triphosphate,3'-diphosphate pyrophosphatase
MSQKTIATIDIGSNTIHLAVGASDGEELTLLCDESEMLQLGQDVAASGRIPDARVKQSVEALRRFKALSEELHAETLIVVATEAVRAARNSEPFLEAIRSGIGIEVQVISGMNEAAFTFLGATHGRNLAATVAVADLGGGSLELLIAEIGQMPWSVSLPLGGSFLRERYAPADPPQRAELAALHYFLNTYLAHLAIPARPQQLIFAGGTVNALLRLIQRARNIEISHTSLTPDDLEDALLLLQTSPAETIARRYDLRVERARVLGVGAMVVLALMLRLGVVQVEITPHGIREGIILSYARYGDNWLTDARSSEFQRRLRASLRTGSAPTGRLSLTTRTMRALGFSSRYTPQLPGVSGSFREVGHDTLAQRFEQMITFRAAVLADEDPEALHDMRVTARRLRTALDTFAACYPHAPFQAFNKQVKGLLRALGQVRDTDVLLERLTTDLADAPDDQREGIAWLIERVRVYRAEQFQNLRSQLRESKIEGMEAAFLALQGQTPRAVPTS